MKIEILKNMDDCTGCEACSNICPVNCIDMVFDEEGFRYPKIDHNACIKCKKCIVTCPVNEKLPNDNFEKPVFFSAISNNSNVLLNSSSGGVFSILAEDTISRGGVVYGCAFDKSMRAHHIAVKDLNSIQKLRGSKYVQSDIGMTMREVKDYLNKGIEVLFSGTSCQISGLRKYLSKDYANLFLVEILCHGVPSPVLFEKHIKNIERRRKGKVINYEFRSKKKYGWGSENRTYYEIERKGKVKSYHPIFTEFFTAFFYGINLRPACYTCTFSKPKTEGDLILGDFWGYWAKYQKNFKQGISVVALNNDKGLQRFQKLYNNFELLDTVSYEEATKTNIHFIKPVSRMKHRDTFYKDINEKGYKQIYKEVYLKYENKFHLLRTFYGKFVPSKIRFFIQKIRNVKR